ncbi:MAG: hypothetical protein Q9187_001354 [Circinaria calcarea]
MDSNFAHSGATPPESQAATEGQISVSYRNLTVYGFGSATDYQKTFANYPLTFLNALGMLLGVQRSQKSQIDILRRFEGLVRGGEMLLVLGRPGSGCSTLLKTLADQTHGLHIDEEAKINYQGGTLSIRINNALSMFG